VSSPDDWITMTAGAVGPVGDGSVSCDSRMLRHRNQTLQVTFGKCILRFTHRAGRACESESVTRTGAKAAAMPVTAATLASRWGNIRLGWPCTCSEQLSAAENIANYACRKARYHSVRSTASICSVTQCGLGERGDPTSSGFTGHQYNSKRLYLEPT